MTVLVSNTTLGDNLDTWRRNTNLAATAISNNTITVEKNGRGGYTNGDGHVDGTFSATTLATSTLSGGNTSVSGDITISSNTDVTSTSLSVSANTTFTGNVDMTGITGTNRLFLPDSSRIRMTGGTSGQYIKIATGNQLGFSYIQFRDFNELETNTIPIILSGANTNATFEGSTNNSPPLTFTTASGEVTKIFLADTPTFNQAYLVTRLSDTGGLSEWQLRNSSNNLIHSMASDGDTVFNADGLPANIAVKGGSGVMTHWDGDQNTILFKSAVLANGSFEFNSTLTAYGDVNLGSDQNDDVNINGRLLLNGQELLGGASGFTFAGVVDMQANVFIGTDANDVLHINSSVANTSFTENVTLGSSTIDEILVNGSMLFNSDPIPNTDDAFDLGSSTKEWKDLYLDGVAYIDELSLGTSATQGVSTSLIPKTGSNVNLGSTTRAFQNIYGQTTNFTTHNVSGQSNLTKVASGNTVITGDLTVTGSSTLSGLTITSVNVTDDSTFGANVAISGSLTVDGDTTIGGNLVFGNSPQDTITMEGQFANSFTSDLKANDITVFNSTTLGNALTDTITLNGTVQGMTVGGQSTFNDTVVFNDEIQVAGHFANQQTTGMANFQNIIVDSTGNWISAPDQSAYGLQVNTKSRFKNDIDADNVNIVNLQVSGSFILPSDVEIAQANGLFTESLRSYGNTVIGNQTTDELHIISTVQTDIIPNATAHLGSDANRWRNIYANNIHISEELNWNNGSGNITVISSTGELNASMIANGNITSNHLDSTGVTSGTYGNSSAIATFTVDEDGRITAASEVAVAGVSSLAFNDANNTITLGTSSGDEFYADLGALEVQDGSITTAKLETLVGLNAGTYGSASLVPIVTVNNKGQVTNVSTASVAGVSDLTYYQANSTLQLDTADGGSFNTRIADVTTTQAGIAKFDTGDFNVNAGTVSLKNATSGAVLSISQTPNEIEVTRVQGTVTIGLPDRVAITDDLQVTNDVTAGQLVSSGILTVGTNATVAGTLGVTGETTLGNTTVNGDITADVLTTTGNATIGENLTVSGNLVVQGTTTTLNTTQLTVDDPVITLADGQTSGAVDAGIEVDRGSDTNVFLKWNETSDKWQAHDGTSVHDIAYQDDLPTNTDTKYGLQAIVTSNGAKIQLTANGSSTNVDGEVSVLGSGSVAVTRNANIITVTGTDTDTVTRINGGSSYESGDVLIQGSGATTVTQSGKTITVSSTDTNDDNYVDSATFNNNVLTLGRTGVLTDLTVDLSSLSSPIPTLSQVTTQGAITTNNLTIGNLDAGAITADSYTSDGATLNITRDSTESILKAQTTLIEVNADKYDRDINIWGDDNTTPIMKFDAGQSRVGIKKTVPSYELDVNGTVNATTLRGNLDYSFIQNAPGAYSSWTISDTDGTSTTIAGQETFKISGGTGISADLVVGNKTLTLSLPQAVATTSDVRFDSFGVGTNASGTSGEIRATDDITAFYSSDINLKENIVPIENALDKVKQVRGVTYDWKQDYLDKKGGEDGYFVRKHDVGVIAQEVEKVLPEVVAERDDGTKAVKYERIVALLIEAVKDLSAEIDELKKNK